ncbi:hypothetical protein Emag_007329 [Eimeria magna]
MAVYLRSPWIIAGVWLLLTAAPFFSAPYEGLCLLVHAADAWKGSSSSASRYPLSPRGLEGQEQRHEKEMGRAFADPAATLSTETQGTPLVAFHPAAGQATRTGVGSSSSVKKGVALATATALILAGIGGGSRLLLRRDDGKSEALHRPALMDKLKLMAGSAKKLALVVGTLEAATRYEEADEYFHEAAKTLEAQSPKITEDELQQVIGDDLLEAGSALVELQEIARIEGVRTAKETRPILKDEHWPDAIWETASANDFVKAAINCLASYEQSSRRCLAYSERVAQSLKGISNVNSVEDHASLSMMATDLERLQALQKGNMHLGALHAKLREGLSETLRIIAVEERGEHGLLASLQLDMLKALFEDIQNHVSSEKSKAKLKQVMPIIEESLTQLTDYHEQQQQTAEELEASKDAAESDQQTIEAALIERHFDSLLESLWTTVFAAGQLEDIQDASLPLLKEALKKHSEKAKVEIGENKTRLAQLVQQLEHRMVESAKTSQLQAPAVYRRTLKSLKELVDIDEDASEVPTPTLHLRGFTRVEDLIKAEEETQKNVVTALHMRRVLGEYELINREFEVYMQLEEDLRQSKEAMKRCQDHEFIPDSAEIEEAESLIQEFEKLVSRIPKVKRQAILADISAEMRSIVIGLENCIYRDKRLQTLLD